MTSLKRRAVITLALAGLAPFASPVSTASAAPEGAYWRVETMIALPHMRPVGSGYRMNELRVSATWSNVRGKHWTAFRPMGAKPATAKDEAAWKADGSPTSWTYRTEGMKVTLSTKPGKGYVGPEGSGKAGFPHYGKLLTYQELQTFPAEPAALRSRIVAGLRAELEVTAKEESGVPEADKRATFERNLDRSVASAMGYLMVEKPLPKPVRAAAFQVLKETEGVRAEGSAKDALGRRGQRFALPVFSAKGQAVDEKVLVDPATFTLLEWDVRSTSNGKPSAKPWRKETFVKVGWTNDKPAIPS
ncbi:hypothetical protein ACFXJ8_39035 [Nonomuraea sp. NPDC059194]|uniref:hypothetical protein n=1 Tax=Nonomuraea sp. NPDC059194 TaxID=3346764 RepID=UPI003694E322